MRNASHLLRNTQPWFTRSSKFSLMELETKLRENLTVSHPMLLSENYLKPYLKDEFPFETPASNSSKGYLQDFHHLDQFHVNGSSTSSNPVFGGIQGAAAACYDPFDTLPYGGSANNFDFYECKPFADHHNHHINVGVHGQVMDNFQGVGYLDLQPHQRNSIDIVGSDRGHNINITPFDLLEMKPMNFVVPDDEVSCVTAGNGYYKKVGMTNKNNIRALLPSARRTTWKGRKKPTVVKGQWTIEEDRLLIQLVEQFGVRKWSHIAQMLPGRIGKQCRERWHNHLRPDIKKDTWSEEEDKVLIQAHTEIGNKWAEIAKRLPGRTENSIKNHWNATKRRQFSKRKCRSKYPRGSLLQEYIKSLNLDSSSTARKREKVSASMAAENNATATMSSKTSKLQAHQGLDFCGNNDNDRSVPEYDFNEVPEFFFDEKLLQESCSIDSLLDEIVPSGNGGGDAHEKSFDMDDIPADVEPAGVLKELDLVEMISQANNL